MNPLRACLLALAVFTVTAGSATAQSLSTNPDAYSLGHALPLRGSLSLRSDTGPGLKWKPDNTRPDPAGLADSRPSLYADWFPFSSNSFRVVGGLSLHDSPVGLAQSGLHGSGLGISPYHLRQKSPSASTYLGIGYGQPGLGGKGLGFYADMGISLGPLAADLDNGSSSMGLEGWRTQNNGLLGFRYLPSVSLGLIYRY